MQDSIINFIEVVGVIMTTLIACDFFAMFMPCKYSLRVKIIAEAVTAAIAAGAVMLVELVFLNGAREGGTHYIVIAACSLITSFALSFLFDGKLFKRIYMSAIIIVLVLLFEFLAALLVSVINKVEIDTLYIYIFYYFEELVVSKLILLVILKVCKRFIKPKGTNLPKPMIAVLLTLPVATFVVIMTMTYFDLLEYDHKNSIALLVAAMVLVVANIAFVYLLEWQMAELNRQKEEALRRSQLENQVEYYKKTLEEKKRYNRMAHDLKNELFALQEIIKKDSASGIERIRSLCDGMFDQGVRYTQNDALNALIYSKVSRLNKDEIAFSCRSVMSEKNAVDDMDLCVIVGNTLDNAIEACTGKGGGQRIDMNFLQQEDYLIYKIRNTSSLPDGTYSAEDFKTSKSDKDAHGFGIKSCKSMAEKYSGSFKITVKDGLFSVDVLLLNPVQTEAK